MPGRGVLRAFDRYPLSFLSLLCSSSRFHPPTHGRSIRIMVSAPSPPRIFPTTGFVTINATEKIEEEEVPSYNPEDCYPVYIGEVFRSRYQIMSKLGFGTNSTAWLCRDLRQGFDCDLSKWLNVRPNASSKEHRYLTLKLRLRTKRHDHEDRRDDREVAVSNHLKCSAIEHPGKAMVRSVLDSFKVIGPNGIHECLLYQPLGISFTEMLELLPQKRLPKDMTKTGVQLLLIALSYLHECHVVHTGMSSAGNLVYSLLLGDDSLLDISPNNVLHSLRDDSIPSQLEQGEFEQPIARKILSDRIMYISRPTPFGSGLPTLCNLGEARVGNKKHRDDIMPGIYRAPEIVLGMDWDAKVDIWAIGVMVSDS